MNSSLALGTAQLGMPYGIANNNGQPDSGLANEIVATAWSNHISVFDTAQGYGESEKVLGQAIKSLGIGADVRIVTKLAPHIDHLDKAALEQAVNESLLRLNVSSLHGLMLHRESLLEQWNKGLGDILKDLVYKGLTKHLGVSVYSPEKALEAMKLDGMSILQLPSNILDRRFEDVGVFEHAARNKKQLFVRSVFLQGLVLMQAAKLPQHMQFAAPVIKRIDALCSEMGLTRRRLALGYARLSYPSSNVLVGVETPQQLVENISDWNAALPGQLAAHVRKVFNRVEDRILNPALWKQ